MEGYSKNLSELVIFYECMFCINGVVNKQIIRVCGVEGSDEHTLAVMFTPSAMKMYVISKDRVIVPYF